MQNVIVASDIVGFGKVASNTALPVLSVMKIEVTLLPTLILSSHTGGLSPYIQDYTKGMALELEQLQKLDFSVDGLIVGYIKNKEQLELLQALIEWQKRKSSHFQVILDPILGDHGQLYQGFDAEHVATLRKFLPYTDLVIPNLTELLALLGRPYETFSEQLLREPSFLRELEALGTKEVVLSGVERGNQSQGLLYYQLQSQKIYEAMAPKWPQTFYGTGDLLTSLLAGYRIKGVPMVKAIDLALNFIQKTLQTTVQSPRDLRQGLVFEPHLGELSRQID